MEPLTVVSVALGIGGYVFGLAADRFATRWPEHDEEHPPGRRVDWRTGLVAVTSALRHRRVPKGVQLWLVPEMNPDGTAADSRQNADGVDLNRNFPYRWRPISDPTYSSGPYAASEPETRAAMRLAGRIRPAVTIWYHQRMDLVDLSGGDRGVARRYAQLADLKPTCLTFLAGVETAWSNHTLPGTTSFVVELPAGSVRPDALARHLRAIRAMELGQRSGSPTRCDSITPAA